MSDEFERDELKRFETEHQPDGPGDEIRNDRPEPVIELPEVVARSPEVGQEPSDVVPHNVESSVERINDDQLKSAPNAAAEDHSQATLNKLVFSQLVSSVPGWLTNSDSFEGAVQLYQKFEPTDATESVLALLAVGMTNASMDGLERANRTGLNPEIRQMELKLAHKGSAAVVDVLKIFQSHRRSGNQKIRVGNVNVGSGGQAIVGNVQAVTRNKNDEER